ncbi:MAG: GNAT family N-acetyltransferase [Candidatus Hydrothermia bacterium]
MKNIEIKNVNVENVRDLINLCIPPEKKEDESFIKGANLKESWAMKVMERYGNFAKLAYLEGKPVGMIQYMPVLEEKLIEITCISVLEKGNLRKGIGRMLLNSLMEEVKEPKPHFNNESPCGLITWAFQVQARYPQHEFSEKGEAEEFTKSGKISFCVANRKPIESFLDRQREFQEVSKGGI